MSSENSMEALDEAEMRKLFEMVESVLGPRWAPPHIFYSTIVLYTLILIIGLTVNLFVIVVSLANSRKMSTSDVYLLSLAVSDLVLLLLGLPFELRDASTELYPYTLPEYICRGRAFLTEMTGSVSSLTITAFAAQRYMAICHPLRLRSVSRPFRRTATIIALVWLGGFMCAFPCLFAVKINAVRPPFEAMEEATLDQQQDSPADNNNNNDLDMNDITDNSTRHHQHLMTPLPGSEYCFFDDDNPMIPLAYIHFGFWTSFVLPLVVIIILYVRIALTINEATVIPSANGRSQREIAKRRAAVNMSVAVAIAFFICWLPFHLQRVLSLHVPVDSQNVELHNFQALLFIVSGFFYYGNTVVNPILYTFMTQRMRKALLRTFRCQKAGDFQSESASTVSRSPNRRRHRFSRTSFSTANTAVSGAARKISGHVRRRSSLLAVIAAARVSYKKRCAGYGSTVAVLDANRRTADMIPMMHRKLSPLPDAHRRINNSLTISGSENNSQFDF